MPCDACIVVAVNVPATHEIDTLSLHDALPILEQHALAGGDTAGTIPARAAVVRKPARGGVRTVLPRQVARVPHAAPERVWVGRGRRRSARATVWWQEAREREVLPAPGLATARAVRDDRQCGGGPGGQWPDAAGDCDYRARREWRRGRGRTVVSLRGLRQRWWRVRR